MKEQSIDKARSTAYSEVRIGLTSKQIEVARLKRQGKTHEEIADELGISDRTSETHLNNARNLVADYDEYVKLMVDDLNLLGEDAQVRRLARILDRESDLDITVE